MPRRRVTLSDDQIEFIRDLASRRVKKKRGSTRKQTSGWNSFDRSDRSYPHAVGLAAEFAYSIETGRPLDESVTTGGDAGDFLGVEVKATTHTYPPFVLAIKQEDYATRMPLGYVLARVSADLRTVEFLGSMSRERFDRKKVRQEGKYALNWVVPSTALAPGLVVLGDGGLELCPFEEPP
jgi:hypothetical protein